MVNHGGSSRLKSSKDIGENNLETLLLFSQFGSPFTMRRAVKNEFGYFDKKLLSYIKDQKTSIAVSMITNVRLRRLSDNSRKTLLHYAAEYDNSSFAQYLINQGCNVDAIDIYNNTPLMTAVCARNEQVIQTLLGAGAKIGDLYVNKKHVMAILLESKSTKDLQILRMLLDKISIDFINNKDFAKTLFKIHCPFHAVVFLKNIELMKLMLDLGCSVDDRLPGTNETALHLAVHFLDIYSVKVLVDCGADVNARDNENFTPLVRFDMLPYDSDDKLEILTYLLDRGASLTEVIQGQSTVMSKLLTQADSRTLKVLMPYIDLFKTDDNDNTPIHHLVENKNPGVVDVLDGLCYDMEALDQFGWTPLDIAADRNNLELVQYLLENGASPRNVNYDGYTCLGYKFISGAGIEADKTRRVIELLLQYGADAQFLEQDESPIFSYFSEMEFVQPLLAHLAMLENVGETLHSSVYETIKITEAFDDYFKLCKLQIEQMKKIIVYESVTLYMLLFECDQKIVERYALNGEFVSSYELFVKEGKYDLDLYYISTLELRVGKIIKIVQTKEKAAVVICEIIIGLPCSMVVAIGHNIVKYLDHKDLTNVLHV